MITRSAVLALAAGLLVTLYAGCGASVAQGQAVTPASRAEQPDPNAPYMVPAPKRADIPVPPPVAAADAPPCSPDALTVEEIAGNAHGGYHSVKLGFRNRTSMACRLSGYPLVALFNPQGQSVGSIAVEKTTAEEVAAELGESPSHGAGSRGTLESASTESTGKPGGALPQVVLMPKAVAAFQVVWDAGENCSTVARLLITAPGTTRTFSVSQPMNVCTGRIQLTPLSLDQEDD